MPGVPVLKDIDFEAQPGQMIALVGPTGAGKSSIINLVSRFYEPQQGRISSMATTRPVTMDSLHRQMGLVNQVNFLFSGTIMDNIRFGRPEATDERTRSPPPPHSALDDLIMHLPKGYTPRSASAARAFRWDNDNSVCFTRALVANPRILILDEATSAVDTATETRIQIALNRLIEGRTSFIVAHRLSTVRRADLVLVIDDGRIVERGTHSELLPLDGRYAQLYEQFIRSE